MGWQFHACAHRALTTPWWPFCKFRSEHYQRLFSLPTEEVLEYEESGTVFDPSLKEHVEGTLYVSQKYMCFLATEPDRCTVILPFRDVVKAEPMDPGEGAEAQSSFADVNGV